MNLLTRGYLPDGINPFSNSQRMLPGGLQGLTNVRG
jgi:hypothetical protein